MEFSVTYLTNSGFLLETGDTLLIFDYTCDCPGIVSRALLSRFEHTVFFASHRHFDHYNKGIFAFADVPGVSYALSGDIPTFQKAVFFSPGQSAQVGNAQVHAFGSTDLGVSFLAEVNGLRVFHAGDLNLWHWKTQSTPEEIAQARAMFDEVLDTLPGGFDAAFFPVDPRLEKDFDEGAQLFLDRFSPRVLIPMHFREDTFAAFDFAQKNKTARTRVLPMTRTGQRETVVL